MTPIEIAAAGPLEVPESYFAEGQVGAGSRAGDVPLLHRPHAFALTHGGLGAKVAYGELHIRVDSLTFDFQEYDMGAADDIIRCDGIGRKDIEKLTPIVPTVESGGDPMNPDNPSIYHQLDGYGSIYLNWTVNLGAFAEGSPRMWLPVAMFLLKPPIAQWRRYPRAMLIATGWGQELLLAATVLNLEKFLRIIL